MQEHDVSIATVRARLSNCVLDEGAAKFWFWPSYLELFAFRFIQHTTSSRAARIKSSRGSLLVEGCGEWGCGFDSSTGVEGERLQLYLEGAAGGVGVLEGRRPGTA